MNEKPSLLIRLPSDIKEKLEQMAKEDGRSQNNFIERLIVLESERREALKAKKAARVQPVTA